MIYSASWFWGWGDFGKFEGRRDKSASVQELAGDCKGLQGIASEG